MTTNVGTYAALKVLEPSDTLINMFTLAWGIPNPVVDKHVTLLYSRNHLPDYEPDPKSVHFATVKNLEMFTSRGNQKCLVLLLDAPTVKSRFDKLMAEHPATYDFPSYNPHITVSYNIGELDINKVQFPSNIPIILGHEYKEDLNDL